MQHIPPLAIVTVTIELLVAGDAPHVGPSAVLFFQNPLRLQNFVHDRAAAQQLRPQLGVILAEALNR